MSEEKAQEHRESRGVILEPKPNDAFRVRLESGEILLCHVPSTTRGRIVRLLAGDEVSIRRSPKDRGRGKITGKLT